MLNTVIEQALTDEAARAERPRDFPQLPEIPGGRYTRQDFYDIEYERVWQRSWVCVGREYDVREPGQFRTFDKLGVPIILVRGRDGVLRAFYNTCRHRGAPVTREAEGRTAMLRCSYHSWSYSLDGKLVSVPQEHEFGCLDKKGRGLLPVRCETFGGLIFLNLDAEAMPLRDYLGRHADELALLRMDKLRTVTRTSYTIGCNWKALADAFLEVYHVSTIHPETVEKMIDCRTSLQYLAPNGHTSLVTRRILGEGDSFVELEGAPTEDMMPETYRRNSIAYTIFPNLIMPIDPFGFPYMLLWPRGPHECELEVVFGGMDWGEGERPAFWDTYLTVFDQVFREDVGMLDAVQKSLRSKAFTGMLLSHAERRIYWLHEEIDRRIGAERVPPGLAVPPLLGEYANVPHPIAAT